MGKISKKRKLRYGTVSLLLVLAVLACVVILNVIAGALCLRYDWMYIEMSSPAVYEISEPCSDYISKYVISEIDRSRVSGGDSSVRILLCDEGTKIAEEDDYKYVYDSLFKLRDMFEGYIEIERFNIWEQPKLAASYGVTSSEDVVCIFNDKHVTVSVNDFYITETVDYTEQKVAYNGERMMISCFMHVTQAETPVCYLTVNHGEVYSDYGFARMLSESGYDVQTLDLYADEIPDDADIIVTFNPKKDLAAKDDTSLVSETEKLEKYMSSGGKYMVFVSSDTFASGGFDNLEGFLSSWGIEYMHSTTEDGIEACRIVRDSANSLTSDGYTVLADYADNKTAASLSLTGALQHSFGKTTYMSFSNDFSKNGEGYLSPDGKRSMTPLFLARNTAVAWADGRPVARAGEEDFTLMSLGEEKLNNGETAYLLASASVDFASGEAMQSAVLGNSRMMTELIKYMGKENAPTGIVAKPFAQTEIHSLTSRNATVITVILAAVPAVAVSLVGGILLIRRKNR